MNEIEPDGMEYRFDPICAGGAAVVVFAILDLSLPWASPSASLAYMMVAVLLATVPKTWFNQTWQATQTNR